MFQDGTSLPVVYDDLGYDHVDHKRMDVREVGASHKTTVNDIEMVATYKAIVIGENSTEPDNFFEGDHKFGDPSNEGDTNARLRVEERNCKGYDCHEFILSKVEY